MSITFAVLYAVSVIVAAVLFRRHRNKIIEKEINRLKSKQGQGTRSK